MTDDFISQTINAAQEIPAPAAESEIVQSAETPETTEAEQVVDSKPEVQDDAPFSKKALNAMSYRDKKIGKLQAQLAADRAELQKYRESEAQKADKPPVAEDFQSYDEYIDAKQDYKISKMQKELAPKAVPEPELERQAWQQERIQYAAQKANEMAKTIPDYTATINENVDFINSLPEGIVETLYEAENGGLALFTLIKEGRLYELSEMSERAAAIAIGRAEARGASYLVKQTTKAPAPIDGLKGLGQSSKSKANMSYEELKKAYKL